MNPTPTPPRRRRLAAAILAGIAAACLGCVAACVASFLYLHTLPDRNARGDHDALRPGMSLREVFTAADEWMLCSAAPIPPDPQEFKRREVIVKRHGPGAYIQLGNAPEVLYPTREELLAAFESRSAELAPDREYAFRYAIPFLSAVRVFNVTFGPDGHVARVSAIRIEP